MCEVYSVLFIHGGYTQIATNIKSFDSRYAYYVSNGDDIETNI